MPFLFWQVNFFCIGTSNTVKKRMSSITNDITSGLSLVLLSWREKGKLMKKAACSILVMLSLLLAMPLFGYAGRTQIFFGANVRVGHPGWRGHAVSWRHPPSVWGPRYYWRSSIVLGPWHPYGYCGPPAVIVQNQPPVYVQPEQQPADYWYYCPNPQGYYPYIKSCPGGWMKVVPEVTPPTQ